MNLYQHHSLLHFLKWLQNFRISESSFEELPCQVDKVVIGDSRSLPNIGHVTLKENRFDKSGCLWYEIIEFTFSESYLQLRVIKNLI